MATAVETSSSSCPEAKTEVSEKIDILSDFLDSDNALGSDLRKDELVALLTSDSGYEALLQCMLLPAPTSSTLSSSNNKLTNDEMKRSFRAMSIMCCNLNKAASTGLQTVSTNTNGMGIQTGNNNMSPMASPIYNGAFENEKASILDGHLLFDHDTAGLVAKQIFQAHTPLCNYRAHNPHLHKLLLTLLSSFPSPTISAAVSGGPVSVDRNLSPLLNSDMSVLVSLVSRGCCCEKPNENKSTNFQQSNQQPHQGNSNNIITRGNRRKFVRSLIEWGLLEKIVDCIVSSDADKDVLDSESACDALFQIVKNINTPPPVPSGANTNASDGKIPDKFEALYGENTLMEALGKGCVIQKLLTCALEEPTTSQGIASSRALMRIFTLATGGKRKKVLVTASPINTPAVPSGKLANNRLSKWGVTMSMYKSLCNNVAILSKGIMADTLMYIKDETLPPFTSRRYCLITVLADMLEIRGGVVNESESDLLLGGICSTSSEYSKICTKNNKSTPDLTNTWLYLSSLLFLYQESNLFHVQYYRIFFSVVRSNHEPSLRFLVQKSKFVSKAISAFNTKRVENDKQGNSSLRGIVLRCLNVLRLQCQCIEPKAYLRHYLESHDGWKGFRQKLLEETSQQQLPGLGLSVPNPSASLPTTEEDTTDSLGGFKIGSPYADSLGFAGAHIYIETATHIMIENNSQNGNSVNTKGATNGGGKKKKGKKKKKK